ncbi:nuclear transport factor 2 family protein [Seonamhaeicola marinus]|uniref:Nuclear transport factor 2 family protein n=1 Tax=Seonamhaeicola marinus TaxID=1912246 RepID=A0A5D0HV36_9FLAO|nr:nuclear transport factor 2 family protein [Seonamhaeicola marinus]TYA74007.1 nuclear transport factor 2 family protein [Seonamhaeicola marinus]
MKFFNILLSTTLLFILGCKQPETNSNDNTKDFKAVEHVVQGVFDDVWSDKKSELLSTYHTDDFILLEHGEVWTNDTIANWCKRAKVRDQGMKRTNSFDFFKAKREGNKIWMAYHNYATFKKDTITSKAQWLESIVAVKQDSIWKLELMHSTYVNQH